MHTYFEQGMDPVVPVVYTDILCILYIIILYNNINDRC